MRLDDLVHRIFLKDGRLRPVFRAIIYIVATVIGAAFLAALATQLGGASLAPSFKGGSPSVGAFLVFEACLCAAIVGVAVLLRGYLDRRSVASLGLWFQRPWLRLLAIGVLLGAFMPCAVFAIDELLGYSHVTAVASAGADLLTIAEYVPLFILVAVAEEYSVRGYLFQNLWEEWGAPAAIVVSSALFAFLHLSNPNSHANLALTVGGLLAFGVWASLSILWTKSLWPAIGAHFAWNLFEGPVLGFPVSGLSFSATAITQTIAGPDWFTGGPFGPESGASAILALAAGLAVLYWMHRRGAFSDAFDAREPYARAKDEG